MSTKRLYKFGRINEYSEQLFSEGSIWFSAATDLNDPFECNPIWRFLDDRKEARARLKQLPEKERFEQGYVLFFQQARQRPEVLESLKKFFSPIFRNGVGICCFTERRENVLMWSHYADNHSGYCLEFEANETSAFRFAEPISYVDTYPELTWFSMSGDERIRLVFLTKFREWSYEKEWRLIDPAKGRGARAYPKKLLKSVTFGLRMKAEQKERIRSWVDRRRTPVFFYQAQMGNDRFEMTFDAAT